MKKMEQFPAKNPNPVLSAKKDGTVLYSNRAGEPLLHEWGMRVGEKLPSFIIDFMQRVISQNSPEKMEIKAGKRVYLIAFHPLPEEECVNIYGFDISDRKELEGKLWESERRYHLLFENMLDGFAYCRMLYDDCGNPVDFIYLDTNSAFERLTGLKEVTGKKATEAIPGIKELHPELFDAYSRVALTGQPERFEIEFKPLGVWLWISVYSTEREHFVATFDNITGRKKAEESLLEAYEQIQKQSEELQISHEELQVQYEKLQEANKALHESEARLQVIIANSPDIIFEQDLDLRYTWIYNPASPLSVSDVIGKTDADLLPPDQAQQLESIKRRVLNTGTREQALLQLSSGGEPRWFEAIYEPHYNETGQVTGVLSYTRDVTERKQAEELLRQSEERYRTLFDSIDEGFCIIEMIFDASGKPIDYRFLETNPAFERLTGLHEAIGKTMLELVPDHEKHWFEIYGNIALTGEPKRFISEAKPLMGGWNDVYAFQFGGRGSNKVAVLFNDITERKEAEIKLKETLNNLEHLVKERTAELENAYNSLKESENGFAEAQKMAHIGNWEWDIVTDKVYWSKEMYRIFGRDPKELAPSYNEYLSYIHPDDRGYFDNIVKKPVNEKPHSIDHRIILANGEERTVNIQAKVIFDEGNIPIRIKGIVQDITERKKTEEKIQDLANVVESSNDAIVTESLDGIIISWNKGAEQIYGYSAEEITGKKASILEPDNIKGEIKQLIEKVKQGEKIQRYETSRLKKDGTIINVSITLSPVFNAYRKLVAISGIARDITENKRAEEALRESEESLRRFYESGMFGVLYYNTDGLITNANNKFLEIVGYTRDDLQAGRINWNKMTPPEYRLLDEHCIDKLKATGMSAPYEKEYIRKDGSRVPIILGVTTFDQMHNEGIAFVLDITERKKAEQALAKTEEARKKEIHHRIKNNLQVISSLLDLQAEKFRDREYVKDSEVLHAFRESQDRVMSIAFIHEELHDGGGNDTLNFSPYIEKLVENLFQTYRLGNTDISLNTDIEENIFFDMDTAVPLGMIVNELITNSLKYAFIGTGRGEIQIKLFSEEDKKGKSTRYNLIVSDNGAGIPENIDFENSDTLGLQLVNILVDQLDGEIELKRDKGTEFTIWFSNTGK